MLIFLGIPLTAGYLTRRWGLRTHGREWFESRFIPRIAPITLYGLLFTIVLLFAIQGDAITADPLTVARIALPLLAYFLVMWVLGFGVGRAMSFGYPKTATMAFTVASNDFELAIAVAVGVWGATSGQALAGVVGPLIEVPVLVALVYVALWLRRRWHWPEPETPGPDALTGPSPRTADPLNAPAMSTVLFVCLHNAGRSQMSAALFERSAHGRHRALSAGTLADPDGHVHPAVVEVMREIGIDLSGRRPHQLTDDLAEQADVVVTMGCGDACPYIPGKQYLDWDLPDPTGQPVDIVRLTRDDITRRVEDLVRTLDGATDHTRAGGCMTRIGINGFGRMGRLALRAAWDGPDLEFAHVNELHGDAATAAHLLDVRLRARTLGPRGLAEPQRPAARSTGPSIAYTGGRGPRRRPVGRARRRRRARVHRPVSHARAARRATSSAACARSSSPHPSRTIAR